MLAFAYSSHAFFFFFNNATTCFLEVHEALCISAYTGHQPTSYRRCKRLWRFKEEIINAVLKTINWGYSFMANVFLRKESITR